MDVRRDQGVQSPRLSSGEPAGTRGSRWPWLLTLPGFAILLVFIIVGTPVFQLLGCRTAGFLDVTCTSEFVTLLMEPIFGIAMLSAIFWQFTAPAVLFALGFGGWRAWGRHRPRRT